MKRIIVFFLSALSSQLAFSDQAKTILPETFTVAALNPENVWDALKSNTQDSYEKYKESLSHTERKKLPTRSPQYDSYSAESSNWYSKSVLNAKIKSFLELIEMMKLPDIVALQEIESAGNTSTVFDMPYRGQETFRSKLAELGYQYIYVGKQDPANPVSVTTAFLSKMELKPLDSVLIGDGTHSTSARDVQVASLDLGKERVVFFNNHWKSKRGGNEGVRVEIARKVAKRIKEEQKSKKKTHIVVMGDFNSAYYEKPLEALGVYNGRPGIRSDALYSTWYELPPHKRWENSFAGVRDTLMGILFSSSLLTRNGLHYVEDSFHVVGQEGAERDKLLDVTGEPFRWQIKFFYNYSDHIGMGYSDHLPLVATLSYKKELKRRKKVKKLALPKKIYFNEITPCTKEESIDLMTFKGSVKELDRKCVKISIPKSKRSLPLLRTGKYSKNYVELPWIKSQKGKALKLVITMVGRYDWRPNVHDPRIEYSEAAIPEGKYNNDRWHPRSNKCYVRKVLQGKGGRLVEAYGRAGYIEGDFALPLASRMDIVLSDLPKNKFNACPWNSGK